ncbi:sigma factor [Crenalkalicoccus roseus]|uniref:sigma factor n=1 Tax=Crenalkalicoccus roseus TaxID=1485588 RepID=UPI0010808CCB|nr:sigma factor [Crenalkalicoccus roseus]
MEQTARDAVLASRILKHIHSTAKRLARSGRIRGMDAEDIAQDLFLDLWRRCPAFDPSRASFPTFADRIIAHRAASLTAQTQRAQIERREIRIDDPVEGADGSTLADILPDPAAPDELDHGLSLDLRRFIESLSPALQRCCAILAEPNIRSAAAQAGSHRSSLYENARRLRRRAEQAGLRIYLAGPRQISTPAGRCPA